MTPDFEYFIRMSLEGDYGHTWWGIFYFDLPVGIVLLLLYFGVVSQVLRHNLPRVIRERSVLFQPPKRQNNLISFGLVLVLSLLLGATSHVAWDAFTHNNKLFTEYFSVLRIPVYFFFEDYPAYHILQHVSSLVGLAIVITTLFCLPRFAFVNRPTRYFWISFSVLTCIFFAVRIYSMENEIKIGHVIVVLISASLYSLLLVSLLLRKKYYSVTSVRKDDT